MTDERFCRKIVEEARRNLAKSEEQKDLKQDERLKMTIIPYGKKTYQRILRLLDEINDMCDDIYLEPCIEFEGEIRIIRYDK